MSLASQTQRDIMFSDPESYYIFSHFYFSVTDLVFFSYCLWYLSTYLEEGKLK